MRTTVYSLLVGIDTYRPPLPALQGCVNDIEAIDGALRARTLASGTDYRPRILLDDRATRAAVIDGFVTHLCLAGPDDVALFYYAGHGSQEPTPPEFWHLEPDRLDETIVCVDSRDPGQHDLADKELAKLLADVAARGAHVLVVLDACHSGSGTRDAATTGVRRAVTDDRPRRADSFLVTPAEAATLPGRALCEADAAAAPPVQGRHVLLAACRDDEEARELRVDGVPRGAFSHVLLGVLGRAADAPTYRDLMKRVDALLRLQVSAQHPLVEATHRDDLDLPFLGGQPVEQARSLTVTYDRVDGWVLDAGAVHAIPRPVGSETTRLALYAAAATSCFDLADALGEAEVTEVLPARSRLRIRLSDGTAPEETATFKAVVTAWPLPPLSVALTGDAAGVERVRTALAASGDAALLLREDAARAELAVDCTPSGGIRLSRADDPAPLCADLVGGDQAAAAAAVARLAHIARWRRVAALANPTTRLRADAVRMLVERWGGPGETAANADASTSTATQLRFDYRFVNGAWTPAQFKLKLVNTSDQRLYCSLLVMGSLFGISPDLLPGGGLWLGPSQEAWAFGGQPITAWIPDTVWMRGTVETNDLLKLIVSTEEVDALLLAQDDLDAPYVPAPTRSGGAANTLARLLGRVQTRALGAGPGSRGTVADWRTTELTVLTYRPAHGVRLSSEGATSVTAEVQVRPHPTLRGVARLVSSSTVTRDTGITLPPAFVDDPARCRPLDLGHSRSGDAPASVLEIEVDEADAHLAVSAAAPLVVTIQAALGDGEQVLPVGFDGEFHLPLGRTRRTAEGLEVRLERLPKAVSTRSLTSAIRILFEKVAHDTLGRGYRYPLLTAVEATGARTDDPALIAGRIAEATRILVYVHGIIGDTLGMAASAFEPIAPSDGGASSRIADHYDVVLAFDYENLKTPIEETARDFKRRLHAVGLGAGHGKTLHIVAHSMGGLVGRWFVEREGGQAVVQRLVLVGTPNGGSPWSTIEQWATTALALGLNALAAAAWPAKALGGLVAALGYVDVSLDQMKPDSPFLRTLAASEDPGVPYTVLAGNTSLAGAPAGDGERERLVSRLLERLSPQQVLHRTTALAFLGRPNDIAVSVASIGSLPVSRHSPVDLVEVASDHISYFTTSAVLAELQRRLTRADPTTTAPGNAPKAIGAKAG